MTLKEKVAEMEPDKINNNEHPSISLGCPYRYSYLNANYEAGRSCPKNENGYILTCSMCWDQEFKDPNEPVFHTLHKIEVKGSDLLDFCKGAVDRAQGYATTFGRSVKRDFEWMMGKYVWDYIMHHMDFTSMNYICRVTPDEELYTDREFLGISVKTTEDPYMIYLHQKVLHNMDVSSFYPVEPIRHDFVTKSLTKDMLNAIYGVKPYEPKPMSILDMEERLKLLRTFENKGENMNIRNKIKNVIFNDPATIVFWTDGTKTVVKCQDGEIFDPEKGLAMAISKRVLGDQGNYFDVFKKWLPEEKKMTKESFIIAIDRAIASVNRLADKLNGFDKKKEAENKVEVEVIYLCEDCKHSGKLYCEEPCHSCCTGPTYGTEFEPKKITNARELGCVTCKHSNKKGYAEEPCRSCSAAFGNYDKWESTEESLPSTEEMAKSVNEFAKVAAEHAGVNGCKNCKYCDLSINEYPCIECSKGKGCSGVLRYEPKED